MLVSKATEKVEATQLWEYLCSNGLNEELQSAYKANHSCETALIRVQDDILKAIDSHCGVLLLLLDLSVAIGSFCSLWYSWSWNSSRKTPLGLVSNENPGLSTILPYRPCSACESGWRFIHGTTSSLGCASRFGPRPHSLLIVYISTGWYCSWAWLVVSLLCWWLPALYIVCLQWHLCYVEDILKFYHQSRTLRSSSDHLRHEEPNFNMKTYGQQAFSIAAPRLWNKFSFEIRACSDVNLFKSKLKTFLFKKVYDI